MFAGITLATRDKRKALISVKRRTKGDTLVHFEKILTEWLIHRENGDLLKELLNKNPETSYNGCLFRAYRLEFGVLEGIMQEYDDFMSILTNDEMEKLQQGTTILLSSSAMEFLIRNYIISELDGWASYSKTIIGCKKLIREHAEQNSFTELPVVYTNTKHEINGLDLVKLAEKYTVNQNIVNEYRKLEEVYGPSDVEYEIAEYPTMSVYLHRGKLHIEQ